MPMQENGVVLFGIDSGNFYVINKFIKYLPNFRFILMKGIYKILKSTIPPLTPPAWSAIMTGKNPGKTGIYDWIIFNRRARYIKIVSSLEIKSPKIWDFLSKKGMKSCIINLPLTYPAQPLNGYLVSGIPAHVGLRRKITYPPDLIKELDDVVDGYEIIPNINLRIEGMEKEYYQEIRRVLIKRIEVFKYLYEKDTWHFFMPVIFLLDSIHHYYWHHIDERHPAYKPSLARKYSVLVRALYRIIDEFLGWLLKKSSEDHFDLIIVSDHGMGPLLGNFLINKFLINEGFLNINTSSGPNSKGMFLFLRKMFNLPIFKSILRNRITKHLIESIFKLLPYNLKEKFTERGQDVLKASTILEKMNPTQTCAYALGEFGQIYVEKKEIIPKLVNKLLKFFSKRGLKIDIFFGNDIYYGKYSNYAPDIVVLIQDNMILPDITLDYGKRLFVPNALKAHHRIEGIFLAYGERIIEKSQNKRINIVSVYDIAPTILSLLDVDVQTDFDGKSLITEKKCLKKSKIEVVIDKIVWEVACKK